MKCDDFGELLSAYDDGELSGERRQFVEKHLSSCSNCRQLLNAYQSARHKITSLNEPVIPDIKAEILSKTGRSKGNQTLSRMPVAIKLLVPGFLIAALAVYLFFITSPGLRPSDFLDKVYAAAEGVSSYRFVNSMVLEQAESEFSRGFDISFVAPSSYSIKATFNNSRVSEIFIDGENVYARTPNTSGIDALRVFGNARNMETILDFDMTIALSQEDTLDLLRFLANMKRLSDANIDGIQCFHYTGDVDMEKYAQRYVDKIIEQNPDAAGTPFVQKLIDIYTGISQQVELWVGKDDYLMRQTKLTVTYPDNYQEDTKAYAHYNYYYPEDLELSPPLDSSHEILPGWYLLTEGIFSSETMTKIHQSDDSSQIEAQITLSNISEQLCSNIQVYLAPGDAPHDNLEIYSAVADAVETSLAPGHTQKFVARWDAASNDPGYFETRQVFVEFKTADGINRIQVLRLILIHTP